MGAHPSINKLEVHSHYDLQRLSKFSHIPLEALSEMFSVFSRVAESASLSKDRFVQILMATKVSEQEALEWFELLDKNHDGHINFCEYVCLLATVTHGDLSRKAQLAFKVFDVNNDGLISPNECESLITEVLRRQYSSVPLSDITAAAHQKMLEIFKYCDRDGNNFLSQQEWVSYIMEDESAQEFLCVVDHSLRLLRAESQRSVLIGQAQKNDQLEKIEEIDT